MGIPNLERRRPCTSFAAADGKFPNGSPRPSSCSSTAAPSWRRGGAAALALSPQLRLAQRVADLPDPTGALYPFKRNDKYTIDRPITDEKINTNYNNFYEFGSSARTIAKAAQALKLRPWTVKIDGMVEKPQEIGIDDLDPQDAARGAALSPPLRGGMVDGDPVVRISIRQAGGIGEAAVVGEIRADGDLPGFVDRAGPAPDLVPMALCRGPDHGGGDQRARVPGHRRLRQAGAASRGRAAAARGAVEIRLQVDQVDRALHFTDQRPKSYWEALQASEYGFWANVNPQVPHPRWSQATEELIGLKASAVRP